MDGVTVGNQKYFSLRLSRQPQQTAKQRQVFWLFFFSTKILKAISMSF